ncbi:MAG: hypothetical protein KAW88_06690, partial [Candidatus Cloacimonetes bacterium]|nr:hypothetical protein [Candidatus Cloacimonadota bacterium]
MKKILIVLFAIMIVNSLFSQSDEIWDIHFQFDISTPSGFSSPTGAETDGSYFYVSNSSTNEIAKFDLDGNWIENFSINGLPFGLHDLTYDGTYFYAGDGTTNTIYEMDFSTQSIVNVIYPPLPIRTIAYDSEQDAFWVTNWFTNTLFLIDRNGFVLNQYVFPINLNGLAYDSYTVGEPYLWAFTGIYTGGDGIIEQFDPLNGTFTGITHNVSEDFPGTHAGGLFCSDNLGTFFIILGGIAKGDPSYLFGYKVGYTPNAYAPEPPVDFTLTADPGGALEVTINWINPSVNLVGNPLTELLEIRLYRDAVLIYTDPLSIIGAPCTYIDYTPSSGMHYYFLFAFNSYGSSSVSDSVWVGEDVPAAVDSLLLTYNPQTGSATLTWINPTTGLHGGPFLDPILGYHIERSDGVVFELTGMSYVFYDFLPFPDCWCYNVTPFNSVGDGGTATSQMLIQNCDVIVIFDLDPTSTGIFLKDVIQFYYPGVVLICNDISSIILTSDIDAVFVLLGIYPNNYVLHESEVGPLVDYLDSGGCLYMEGGDTWFNDNPTSIHSYFNINPVNDGDDDLSDIQGLNFLSGMNWTYTGENNCIDHIEPISPADTLFQNLTPLYNCGVTYDAGNYKTVGISFELTGIEGINTLDDAVLGILNFFDIPMSVFGYIAGYVNLIGGNGDVTEVEVILANMTTNPDPFGFFMFEVLPGTYDLFFNYEHYFPVQICDVIVYENDTTYVNVDLYYLEPPVNLNYQLNLPDVLLSWEEPQTILPISEYNIYRNDILIGLTTEIYYFDYNVPIGTYEYYVTTMYEDYESIPSDSIIVEVTDADGFILVFETKLYENSPNPFNPAV